MSDETDKKVSLIQRLQKRRDLLKSKNSVKKPDKNLVTILLSPKNENGINRVKEFSPHNRFLKSYVVNEKGVGVCIFAFPFGIPSALTRKVADTMKNEIDKLAKDDIDTTVFV